ncbi:MULTISPECIES: glycosyltransferase family 4 protein [unclassified Coleofasciculus]|uniref:glycosyltransferase family 4 protein n=1 Tax=unclassified Coleofasciculus TaxID=2692782 RepID=UPI00187E0643|nr:MULTISPECIES: glycosyltransferase family 4 protein [unclassified Coleofasciculus]MBE9127561.1 glycosyltransferase family 4 protein [Coleofasciculus sp. LEGE 07081]MBE9147195.1 glycosyltransferase family 4 protein [Coleofasciculus sp. LEGE 07092]
MKVLRINQSDTSGGAAIAVYRLHQGLLAQGIESRFLVNQVNSSSNCVDAIPPRRRIDYQLLRLTRHIGFNDIHLTSTFDILKHSFYQEADILHFHNLHGGYFNYLVLPSLTKNKPSILTLHDMWAITGHCAYSFDCDRWKIGCGRCPYLHTYPAIQRDSTRWEWQLKNWVYSRSNLCAVVTTSRWHAEQARQSMLSHVPVHRIPPGLDTQAYQPLDSEQCRVLLGIPTDKKVLMFAAAKLNDPRKGGDLLIKALQSLPESLKTETILLILGNGGEAIAETVGIPTLNLGFVGSDHLKSVAYSAADLFLFPTRAENFGLVAQEAMACGTPTVSFKIGGVPDLVRPGVTGYLAKPEDVTDFCNGIMQLLEDRSLREYLGQQCRRIVLEEYQLELYAQRYIELYHQALAN